MTPFGACCFVFNDIKKDSPEHCKGFRKTEFKRKPEVYSNIINCA